MQILKKIKINNRNYYAVIDLEYKKCQNDFPIVCIKNYKDDYWDSGDCSILIEKIEENYSSKKRAAI